MAYKVWIGDDSGNEGDPATAANWLPSGVPVDGDHVIIDGRAQVALIGTDQSSIELASLRIYKSCTANIGSRATPWQIGATLCEIGLPSESGGDTNSGPETIAIDFTADPTVTIVHDARETGADGAPCVNLRGTDSGNIIDVRGGSVGIGTLFPGEAATVATLHISGDATRVFVGFGVTLTTANQRAGFSIINCAATTVNLDGGELETRGSGAFTTFNCRGTAVLNSTGTITTLNVAAAGAADFSQSPQARTVTTLNMYGPTASLNLDNNAYATGAPVVTITNGIQLLQGARPSQISSPTNLEMTLASV